VCKIEAQQNSLYAIAINPEGSTVAGGGYQKAYLWDISSGSQQRSFPLHRRVTNSLAFTPDGTMLVTRSYGDLAIWSLTGERRAIIEPIHDGAGGLAVSPQGIIGITNRTDVELWSLTGERLAKVETEHYLWSAAFHPTGDMLAVGSADGDITVINVGNMIGNISGTNQVIGVLKAPRGGISQLSWSIDGTLAAGCYGAAELWSDRAIGEPPSRAAARANDGDVTERLQRIRLKIAKRELKLQPPAELSEVEAIEALCGVTLPLGFRRFVTEIGNGGGGPPAYGLVPLLESVKLYCQALQPQVPFPFTEGCFWEDEEEARRTELTEASLYKGFLYLGTDGCGMDWVLITSGTERGQVWQITEMGAHPVTPRRDFLSWYEYWVDGGDDYWG
jgi:WD40 repeat protein